MRFGLKIFLMAFTLVIITINIIGINLINNTYQTNINNAIEKHLVEINNIMNSVIYYSPDNIIRRYYTNGKYIQIYINNEHIICKKNLLLVKIYLFFDLYKLFYNTSF